MLDPNVFIAFRFLLFFPVTYFVYKSMQAIDFSKIFRPNSSEAIRLLFMVISVVLGFLFVHAFVSLLEYINQLFS